MPDPDKERSPFERAAGETVAPPSGGATGHRGRSAARRLLGGGAPRALLPRLVHGDPLGMRPRVGAFLRGEGLFLDADRVHLRALALCAYESSRAPRRGDLEPWFAVQIERAVRAVLKEEALATAPVCKEPACEEGVHRDLAPRLHLDPARARAACTVLNRRPREERLAFRSLVVEGTPLDEVARAEGASASEVARRARAALVAALESIEAAAPLEDTEPKEPGG